MKKMKKILIIIFIAICSITANAGEFQSSLYPDTNQVTIAVSSNADTIIVTINNLSPQSITDFYLTANTTDSVFIISNIIDGNASPVISYDITEGTLYPNLLCTRWIIGTLTQTAELKFYTSNSDSSHITFWGKQPFAFFGIAEPVAPNCCIGTRGDINGDLSDNIDISDLVFLVDFSFGTPVGPAPPCFEEADVDASGQLDISDVVLIVNYMFSVEGNVPPENCP